MDVKDISDIQESKKYSHIRVVDGLSIKKHNILRKVMIEFDEDFKRMAREE